MIMIGQDFLAMYMYITFFQTLSSAIVTCRNVRKINVNLLHYHNVLTIFCLPVLALVRAHMHVIPSRSSYVDTVSFKITSLQYQDNIHN